MIKTAKSPLLWVVFFSIIFLNSQIVFFNVHNPMSIRGLQEVFNVSLFLSFFVLMYFSQLRNEKIDSNIIIFSYLIIIAYITDALFSYLSYGQPFILGLIESRRILAGFILIPVYIALRKKVLNTSNILLMLYVSGLITAFIAVLVNFGLLPELMPLEKREGAFREDRMSIGTYYLVFSALLANYYFFTTRFKFSNFIALLFLLFVLVTVTQTRNVLFATLLTIVFINFFILKKYVTQAVLIIGALAAIGVVYLISPEIVTRYLEVYLSMFSSESTSESVRFVTYTIILENLYLDYFMPKGSLSLLWGGGFNSYYGHHFFLSDVGLLGSFFRYGLFAFVIWFVLVFVMYKAYKEIPLYLDSVRYIFIAWSVYFVITLPLSAPLEYRGYILGLIIALAVGSKYSLNERGTHE